MQARSILASLILATATTASPVPTDTVSASGLMVTYCDATNLGGSCTSLDSSAEKACTLTKHATKSIMISDGWDCDLFVTGGCGPSGQKFYTSGTYNEIEAKWANSAAITCFKVGSVLN